MRSVEDELWWYRTLRAEVLAAIKPTRANFDLLDAGCGSGGMLSRIHEQFPQATLTGLDFSERALELTRGRATGATLLQGRVDQLPFGEAQFDCVLSLDVLVVRGVDDRAAMAEMFRVLRPGGQLILNLPAFDFLRGRHDAAVNNIRRETKTRVGALLRAAGFRLERWTYWNMSLTPAIAAARWLSRGGINASELRSDLKPVWPPLNAALVGLTSLEFALSRVVSLPFGSSLFAVARK